MIRRHWPWLGLTLLLVLTWLAYRPGLHGGFLFDDFVNLTALNSPGPVDDWPTFWRFITSGTADPTGRPLALLSFLIDAREWPADPAPFLRTNLLLHLLNGTLLFVLLRMLGQQLGDKALPNHAAALLGAGLWMLHPLLVSTTLYIVQREAMLPATFTLLGLLGYVHGRAAYHRGQQRAGMLWMLVAIGGGTVLALLSKANGILLPMLAWVLATTVLRKGMATDANDRSLHRLHVGLLVLPSTLVLLYLASRLPQLNEALEHRPWTIGQRLLTEPRVLLDYLQLLAVPRVLSTGLYNDGYVVSTSLLQPAVTLPALLLVLSLVALGFCLRRRAPTWAAALLFFFAGHLLESTTIPLEMYFEHRNYLPAMLLFWPVARALFAGPGRVATRAAVATALMTLYAAITWQRADLWGKPDQMAQLWALQNPASSRAQATAASFEARSGQPQVALQRLQAAWPKHPHDLQLALNYANAACAVNGLSGDDVDRIANALRHADQGHQLVFRWLGHALDVAAAGVCTGLDLSTIHAWLVAAEDNPILQGPGRVQDLASLAGRLALLQQQPDLALSHFNRALAAFVNPEAAAMQAAMLATKGYYAHALAHLDHYERIKHHQERATGWNMQRLHGAVLDAQDYWPYELGLLRTKLVAEIAMDTNARPASEFKQGAQTQ